MNKVYCLGFFDCVHLGHRALIDSALDTAKELSAVLYALTFSDGFFQVLGKDKEEIYTLSERKKLLYAAGVESVEALPSTSNFLMLSPIEFLNRIIDDEVCGVVCGEDYTFGKDAAGNVELLSDYLKKRGIKFKTVPLLKLCGEKVSSSAVRALLKEGAIEKANILLGAPYGITGEVVRGKGNGRKFGVPTANILPPNGKLLPKFGVYKTRTEINGIIYRSLTNVGTQPTFNGDVKNVETMILNFEGDLYGKIISVSFLKRIRDVMKFPNPEALYKRIKLDTEEALND